MNNLLMLKSDPIMAAGIFFATSHSKRRRFESDVMYFHTELEDEENAIRQQVMMDNNFAISSTISSVAHMRKVPEVKKTNVDRNDDKRWWTNGFNNWDDDGFKHRVRLSRESFLVLLEKMTPFISKEPTLMVPEPIEPHRQLGLTLYRLAHGVSYSTISDLFGVSMSLAERTFNDVTKIFSRELYGEYVKLPNEDEWKKEAIGFIENYHFPCVAAWDGFHVFIGSNLKNHYSFKKRYSVSNMGLVSYNKRFLAACVDAPGSTHDSRLLQHTKIFNEIVAGRVLPNRGIDLGERGEIPLVTVGDCAFPRHSWLLKPYPDTPSNNEKKKLFNIKLRSARVVTENCYGMLKGRWRILYKTVEVKKHNVKYVIMSCIMLHNLCIEMNDPCNPRWILKVKELGMKNKWTSRGEDRTASMQNSEIISNWLWDMCNE